MANLSLFSKILSVTNSSRLFLNNRIQHVDSRTQLLNRFKSHLAEETKNLPEKPKKPLLPFLKFSLEQRSSITKQHPNLKFTEISKKCADHWRTIDNTLKDKYLDAYKREMETYTKEKSEYLAKLTEEQKILLKQISDEKKSSKQKRALKKKFKETNKPKRPLVAYIFFALEQSKLENKIMRDMLSQLKDRWANISPTDKEKYLKMAADDKKRYENEMSVWEAKMLKEGNTELVRQTTLANQTPSRLKSDKKPSGVGVEDDKKSAKRKKSAGVKKPSTAKEETKIDKE